LQSSVESCPHGPEPTACSRAILAVLLGAAALVVVWGRLFHAEPTNAEAFARITVVWAAAALGASSVTASPARARPRT